MAEDQSLSRDDIKRLLKTFGVQTEQKLLEFLEQHPEAGPLSLRIVIEDRTDYGEFQPTDKFKLSVDGNIRR